MISSTIYYNKIMFNKANLKTPIDELKSISQKYKIDILSYDFPNFLDNLMPTFRSKFYYPKKKDIKKSKIFLTNYHSS